MYASLKEIELGIHTKCTLFPSLIKTVFLLKMKLVVARGYHMKLIKLELNTLNQY